MTDYLSQLSAIKDNLVASQTQLQNYEDNIANGANELLSAKVNDIAEKLEAIGGGGLALMKAGEGVKALYNKWRGKKDDSKDGEDEEGEEGEDRPPAQGDEPSESTAQDTAHSPNNEGGEADQAEPPAEEESPNPEQTQPNEEAEADEGDFADTSNFPAEQEMSNMQDMATNPETSVMETSMDSGAQVSSTTSMGTSEGLESTRTQQQMLDTDPEEVAGLGDTTADTSTTLLDGASTAVNDAVSGGAQSLSTAVSTTTDGISSAVSEGSSAIFDTVAGVVDGALDAIPVVGEIAMVGTAIAGIFESIFGHHHHSPPPTQANIVSGVGADTSKLVQKQSVGAVV